MKLLIVEYGYLGDVIMSSPIYRAIIEHGHEVDSLGLDLAREALEANPYIKNIYTTPNTLVGKIKALNAARKRGYDLAITLNTSFVTNCYMRLLSCYTAGYDYKHLGFMHVKRIPIAHRTIRVGNRIDEVCDLIEKIFDWKVIDRSMIFDVKLKAIPPVAHVIAVHGNTRTTQKARRWDKFPELCRALQDKYDLPIFLTGAKEDFDYVESIRKAVGSDWVWNMCGKFTLREFTAALHVSRIFITVNTGVMQIAIANNRKSVV